jgi:hypothetical protein
LSGSLATRPRHCSPTHCSDENLAAIAATPIHAYISTRKQKHSERPGPLSAAPAADERDARRPDVPQVITKRGAAFYAARKGIVDPVIETDQAGPGFRQFLLRGFEHVQGEWRW